MKQKMLPPNWQSHQQSLEPKVALTVDRRRFLAACGATMGFGLVLTGFDQLLAIGDCQAISMDVNASGVINGGAISNLLSYWIDGIHLGEPGDSGATSDLPSRANLSIFINNAQSPGEFVESVVLTRQDNAILAASYYDANSKTISGKLPYVIFENVELSSANIYYIYTMVRRGTNLDIYRYELDYPRRSRLNANFLPTKMLDDFAQFVGDNKGLVTSPWEFYTQNTLSLHTARGIVNSLNSDGTFRFDVELMHADASTAHYMRYFIITDPVGRLLGLTKRNYLDPLTQTSPLTGNQYMPVTGISSQDLRDFSIDRSSTADMRDCPYVQIFTEDVFDALARSVVWIT